MYILNNLFSTSVSWGYLKCPIETNVALKPQPNTQMLQNQQWAWPTTVSIDHVTKHLWMSCHLVSLPVNCGVFSADD